jgi:hypothetical protein
MTERANGSRNLVITPVFVSYLVTLLFPCYTNLMKALNRYPCNPPLRLVFVFFGGGLLWIAAEWLQWGPSGIGLWFSLIGLIPMGFAVALGVRWIWCDRYLVLDSDSMMLPVGLFQIRTAKIEYTSIRRVWRHYIRPYEFRFVLKVATGEQVFKILPAFLPNSESYRALEEFLNGKFHENTPARTPQDHLLLNRHITH